MKRPLVYPKSSEEDRELQKLIEFYIETLGYCPNSIKTMHIMPTIDYAFIGLNMAVMENRGRVTSALKRMIAYISSNTAGCRYCHAHAIRAAARYGAEKEKLKNNWDYKTYPSFSESERAALDFAFASSTIPNAFLFTDFNVCQFLVILYYSSMVIFGLAVIF
jgi:alkylhydroperoxidase family enzyme